jgi:Rieske Fe-S protein
MGMGAAGAAGVLAACSNSSTTAQPAGGTPPPDASGQSTSGVSIPIAIVPVGGAHIDFSSAVIVTQPEAGQFRAFDANCTHMRCFITWVAGELIQCPCHGSEFRISDGSVARGPATRPLDPRNLSINGDVIVVS